MIINCAAPVQIINDTYYSTQVETDVLYSTPESSFKSLYIKIVDYRVYRNFYIHNIKWL